MGAPLGIHLDSASPAEVKLAEVTLQTVRVSGLGPGRPRTRPERVIADKAYNAWLQNFRRFVVRYERSALTFLGLVHMACALIALKRVVG